MDVNILLPVVSLLIKLPNNYSYFYVVVGKTLHDLLQANVREEELCITLNLFC